MTTELALSVNGRAHALIEMFVAAKAEHKIEVSHGEKL